MLLHELTHLAVSNHSPTFWKTLEAVCPWHREARAWLHARFSGTMQRPLAAEPLIHPRNTRALRKTRIHGASSPQPSGCHDHCTDRNTRSGCGITIVNRPSAVVTPVRPPAEPFGLSG